MALSNSLLMLGLVATPVFGLIKGPWSNVNDDPDTRAKMLVGNMTLEEKLVMLHGPMSGPCCSCNTSATCAYVGNVLANTRLDIPPLTMNDGPQGFRDNVHPGSTTSWPSGLTMAASWDVEAMMEWGTGMGKEFFAKGANVQLGPGLCLARVPRNGRNFEYLSGEDPFLGYTLVQPVITGIQSQKVVANAKHYVMNNEETNRGSISAEVDERTRFEMYYPAFAGAVEADVGSIMCSYNKINGVYSCENPDTLAKDLKTTIGFKGFVMSDWGATHSTSIMEGLDIEMPTAKFMNPDDIKAKIANGTATEAAVTESVTRILRALFAVGTMDVPTSSWSWKKQGTNCTTEASVTSARKLSAASTVLLKNDGAILPLSKGKKIALIGFAGVGAVVHGGGSGSVVPSYTVSPMEGIADQDSGATIKFDDGTNLESAKAAAKDADYAIVFVGTLSHEGGDRASLSLDDGCVADGRHGSNTQCEGNANNQNAMVEAIAGVNKNTIVVMSIPGAVLLPWNKQVAAILTNFMPGQQAGNAIADVLYGVVNPSAKLPITLPNKENETELSPRQWPGYPDPANPAHADYSEKLNVGYRYYDTYSIDFTTGYPFGHGLSYTTFGYSTLTADSKSVSFTLTNTGGVQGAEVVQLYLGYPKEAGEPPKVLRGFQKVNLEQGAKQSVTISLTPKDLSIWDVSSSSWKQIDGTFSVFVGSSNRDIRLQGTFDNKPTF